MKNKFVIYLENHPEIAEQVRLTGRAEKTIRELKAEGIENTWAHNTWWGFRKPSFDRDMDCRWEDKTSHVGKLPPSLDDEDWVIVWTPRRSGQVLPASCH